MQKNIYFVDLNTAATEPKLGEYKTSNISPTDFPITLGNERLASKFRDLLNKIKNINWKRGHKNTEEWGHFYLFLLKKYKNNIPRG